MIKEEGNTTSVVQISRLCCAGLFLFNVRGLACKQEKFDWFWPKLYPSITRQLWIVPAAIMQCSCMSNVHKSTCVYRISNVGKLNFHIVKNTMQ